MADVVTDAVDDLKARLATVTVIKKKVVYLYDQDDLLSSKDKIGFPAAGVVYVGLKGNSDSSKTGLAAELVCDIYLIGGEQCISKVGDLKITTTQLLDDMRNTIKCGVLDRPGAQRKWQFVMEAPTSFSEEVVAYVQRWKTVVLLTG